MAQARRSHLERQIVSYKCDLVCTTDRRPRPQILICTKTTKSHERRVKQYQEDLQQLAAVRALQAHVQTASPDLPMRKKWKSDNKPPGHTAAKGKPSR
jgi:hypothetical protein